MLEGGHSLSGHERNCCFINLGSSRFADVSAAVGLDLATDSRAFAAVDWDFDGDIDIWMTNRTQPRIQFYRNNNSHQNHYLAVKLRGVTCNRDAIGARVEIILNEPSDSKLMKTLSAGEGFIAQSSRWLHFGLGRSPTIDRLLVHWPGGEIEEIAGLTIDKFYTIEQGSGQAQVWNPPQRKINIKASKTRIESQGSSARIVLPCRLPLPRLNYLSFDGQLVSLNENIQEPTLVTLWASWCQPCMEELSLWKQNADSLREASLSIIPINVDHVEENPESKIPNISRICDQLSLPFESGVATVELVDILESAQRILINHQSPLPVPTSFLLDSQGRLAVVYKGPVSLDQLLSDVATLNIKRGDPRDFSVPFPGRWYTEPTPPDLLAITNHLLTLGLGSVTLDYLRRHVSPLVLKRNKTWTVPAGMTVERVSSVYFRTGELLMSSGDLDQAIESFRWALRIEPQLWKAHVALASILIAKRDDTEALRQSHRMLNMRSGHPIPLNNIAWILATTNNPEIRDPQKAVEIAQQVCQSTSYQEPTAMDTLSVAYAASGKFSEAISIAKKAIALTKTLGRDDLSDRIQKRLQMYQEKKPFEPSNMSHLNDNRFSDSPD